MSRFFETLREVSRSQPAPSVPLPNEKAAPSGGGLPDFPLVEFPEAAAAAAQTAPERPVQERRDEMFPDSFLDSFTARLHEFTGKAVSATLDRKTPLIPHTIDGSIVEHYRRLRTKIQQQHAIKPIRSLLIASPGSGDGKTVTLMNLALSYALLPEFKVLVIDGDLRKGTIGRWLGLHTLPGLSNLIHGSAEFEDVVVKPKDSSLHFMMSGTSKLPAAELLTSPLLPKAVRRATEYFDLVLVDSPAVNLIADAQMLAESCDGILLVARAFSTTGKAFQKTLSDLSQFRIIGTVLNGGMRQGRYYGYGY